VSSTLKANQSLTQVDLTYMQTHIVDVLLCFIRIHTNYPSS
jgi:hypothetical protein